MYRQIIEEHFRGHRTNGIRARGIWGLENGVLNHTANAEAKDADATIVLDRATLNKIILKK
jgi:alkyl sulfatase BDS1-like metallo-beta-lactamase superfamily hydrolase